jgi:hypothetical protein
MVIRTRTDIRSPGVLQTREGTMEDVAAAERIAELEAELESSKEACRRVLHQYDQQAVALFEMRRALGEIANGDEDAPAIARRMLEENWLRVHGGREQQQLADSEAGPRGAHERGVHAAVSDAD